MQKNEVIQSIRWNGIIFIIAGIIYSISAVPFLSSAWWWNEFLSGLVFIIPLGFIIYLFRNPSMIKKIGSTNAFLFLSFILLALILWASWPHHFFSRLIPFIFFGIVACILNTLVWFLLRQIPSHIKNGMVGGLLGGVSFTVGLILYSIISSYMHGRIEDMGKSKAYTVYLSLYILVNAMMIGSIGGYFIGEKKRAFLGAVLSIIVVFVMFLGFLIYAFGE